MYLLKLMLMSSMLLLVSCSSIDSFFGPIEDPPTEVRDAALRHDTSSHENIKSQNQEQKTESDVLRQEVKVLLNVIDRMKAKERLRLEDEESTQPKIEEVIRLKTEETIRLEAEETARLEDEKTARLKAEETATRLKDEEAARLDVEETAARLKAEETVRLEAEETARLEAEAAARLEAEKASDREISPSDQLWVTVSVRPGFVRLTEQTYDTLAKLAAQFMSRPREETLEIRGYTDDEPIGGYQDSRRKPAHPFKTNIELSEARARSVANALIEAGIPKDKIHVQGYGATNFIVGNNTAEERAKNRRTEIHLILR